MRRILWVALVLVALWGCGSSGGQGDDSSPTSTLADDGGGVATTSSGDGEAVTLDPCLTMEVDPSQFAYDTYPELVEVERGPIDADWLRVDGAVGCLVELTPPGGNFRAVGVEGYVFDPAVTTPEALVESRVASSAFDITSTVIEGFSGVYGLLREDAETPYAVALESGGVGVFVQTGGPDVDPAVLVAVAESIGGG